MKRVIFSPLFLTLWVIFSVVVSFSLIKSLFQIQQAKSRIVALEQRNLNIETNIADLQIKIREAETQFAKEKIIRDELGLSLPGETVVQVKPVPLPGSLSQSPSPTAKSYGNADQTNVEKTPPVYAQWLELFFGD